ncbi:MAG: hypothetical protein JWN48_5050 [Myxococcaceae bacterium]|nr:hypothetical protein [Myxococcaceae bacterium]
MLRGSCLCGQVRYQAEGPLEMMTRCHCADCRKASGAEFATNGTVPAASFRLLGGHDLVGEYESSPGKFRAFCTRCGSPLFARTDKRPEQVRLRVGTLDSEIDQQPLYHLFVRSKPGWSEILDELPQFEGLPD